MTRRTFSREFKIEAVRLVRDRGVSVPQAAATDLFSRRLVGWPMNSTMTSQLVVDALMMAVWRRGKPDALLHHSDHGSPYTRDHFQRLLADHGIQCSMSRAGNVWDNVAMESFFSSLKTERTARTVYRTRSRPHHFRDRLRGTQSWTTGAKKTLLTH